MFVSVHPTREHVETTSRQTQVLNDSSFPSSRRDARHLYESRDLLTLRNECAVMEATFTSTCSLAPRAE